MSLFIEMNRKNKNSNLFRSTEFTETVITLLIACENSMYAFGLLRI
jgi:hypothetical protein